LAEQNLGFAPPPELLWLRRRLRQLLFRSHLVLLKGLFGKLPKKTGSPRRIRPVADWQPVLPIRDIRVICGF